MIPELSHFLTPELLCTLAVSFVFSLLLPYSFSLEPFLFGHYIFGCKMCLSLVYTPEDGLISRNISSFVKIFCDHSPFSQVIIVNKMFHLEPSPRSIEDIRQKKLNWQTQYIFMQIVPLSAIWWHNLPKYILSQSIVCVFFFLYLT
jgi:hypothetical protein